MPTFSTIGQRLQYVRSQRDLTLDQLAERSGLSKSFLWGVEHDRSGISGEKLLRVANVLGASLDFLLRGEPVPEQYEPPSVEIPRELGELAEELGLTYRQTMAILDVDKSIVARRSSTYRPRRSKEDWRNLYNGVKEFLKEEQ